MRDEPFRTIIEPVRIRSVEPKRLTTRAEPAAALVAADSLLPRQAGSGA